MSETGLLKRCCVSNCPLTRIIQYSRKEVSEIDAQRVFVDYKVVHSTLIFFRRPTHQPIISSSFTSGIEGILVKDI